jgi:hypothetical protein
VGGTLEAGSRPEAAECPICTLGLESSHARDAVQMLDSKRRRRSRVEFPYGQAP